MMSMNNIKPDYYKAGEMDVIAFCQYHDIPFDLGNVIKYVTRAGKKYPEKELEDLMKAHEYLERRIQYVMEHKYDEGEDEIPF